LLRYHPCKVIITNKTIRYWQNGKTFPRAVCMVDQRELNEMK
jgi:hypothetical protein